MNSTSSSQFYINPLHNSSCLETFKTFLHLMNTSIGPHGKLKLLQNSTGKSVTVTSSSQRLLYHISVNNVFLKVILSVAKSQLKAFNDNGLYCILLILKSVNNANALDLTLPLIGTLYEHFAKLFVECFQMENNIGLIKIDFSNLCHLQCVVGTLLSSKPGCILSVDDKNHLCTLLLEVFLKAIPNTCLTLSALNIRFLTSDHTVVKHSKLYNGTLVPISRTDIQSIVNKGNHSGPFKVSILKASLSGDVDFPVSNLEHCGAFSVLEVTASYIETIIGNLISEKTHFIFCQKVLHPRLKTQLEDSGITVLDRLGLNTIENVQNVSGSLSNESLASNLVFGTISSFKVESIGKKNYLFLSNKDIPFFTLVLGHCNEEAAKELEVICHQVLDALFRILKNPKVCFGGGCTEMQVSHFLRKRVKHASDAIGHKFGTTSRQVQNVFDAFVNTVIDVCVSINGGNQQDFVTENINGHLWRLQDGSFPTGDDKCVCSFYSAADLESVSWVSLSDVGQGEASSVIKTTVPHFPQTVLLDELSCKLNSFTLAFEAAALLMKTTLCINNHENI